MLVDGGLSPKFSGSSDDIDATVTGVAKAARQSLKIFNLEIQYSTTHFVVPTVSTGFRNMRNNFVHEGAVSYQPSQQNL